MGPQRGFAWESLGEPSNFQVVASGSQQGGQQEHTKQSAKESSFRKIDLKVSICPKGLNLRSGSHFATLESESKALKYCKSFW